MEVSFFVPVTPTAKGRARSCVRGRFVRHYTPKKTADYEELIAAHAKAAMNKLKPFADAVSIELILMFKPPESWSKKKKNEAIAGIIKHTKKPDCDNLLKAISDAMNGIVFIDDSQAPIIYAKKIYAKTEGVFVLVKELDDLCLSMERIMSELVSEIKEEIEMIESLGIDCKLVVLGIAIMLKKLSKFAKENPNITPSDMSNSLQSLLDYLKSTELKNLK